MLLLVPVLKNLSRGAEHPLDPVWLRPCRDGRKKPTDGRTELP